jgi:lipopolysaccharide heptosyltransferase I
MAWHIELPDSPRIAIVRLSAIGDVIHGLPVLCALRDRFPRAVLGWVVEDRAAALLKGHAALDELIIVPRGWLTSVRAVWDLRRRLRAFRPDVTIDLQGLAKSAIAARLSGCRQRIGFGDDKGRELSAWLNNRRVATASSHIIDCNLELLRPLGIESLTARFGIPETSADAAIAEQIIGQNGLGDGFAVLNPGAGWTSKLWPADRYAAVARHLGRCRSLPSIVVWAGQQEHAWAEEIVAGSEGHARLAPRTSLTELAALVRRARLFVGSDTGPMHLAAAVGTPCVGLFGPMPAERNGPYGPGHIALQKARFEGTSRQRRSAPSTLMEAITVEHVCEACEQILERNGKEAA